MIHVPRGTGAQLNRLDSISKSTTLKPGSAGLEQLQLKLDRQHMVIQTLLILLIEKKVISEEEFTEWLNYVDGLDGRRDGRLTTQATPKTCARCGRNNPPHAPRCQYCGTDLESPIVDARHKNNT